jgi:hypothetical protein
LGRSHRQPFPTARSGAGMRTSMPRQARSRRGSATACYHLLNRGHNRETVFAGERDRATFLARLDRYRDEKRRHEFFTGVSHRERTSPHSRPNASPRYVAFLELCLSCMAGKETPSATPRHACLPRPERFTARTFSHFPSSFALHVRRGVPTIGQRIVNEPTVPRTKRNVACSAP